MFPQVQAEEMAFAMTLFVSGANGRMSMGRRMLTTQNRLEGERLFIQLSAPSERIAAPNEMEAALRTQLYEAFLIVWEHYRGHGLQASIGARILGFYYLVARSEGSVLKSWTLSSEESETVELHPAVVQAVASVALPQSGRLDEDTFLRAVEFAAQVAAPSLQSSPSPAVWPAYAGEMASLVRVQDWSSTPLGPVELWPQSLKTVVDLTLACRFPMIVLWGKDLTQIYNDSYRALMGNKHPAGLGQPTHTCWPEVWNINEPIYARVLGGETVTLEDGLYPIERYGHLEQAYFTLCYSPLRNTSAAIEGLLVTVFETTDRVLAALARDSS